MKKQFFVLALVSAFSIQAFAADEKKMTYKELSPREQSIYDDGPISQGSYIGGGIVGTLIGFGIGHGIQGQYMPMGLVFTLTELVSLGMMVGGIQDCTTDLIGLSACTTNGLGVAGAIAFTGLRIWEIVDVWVAPTTHNRKYRRIKKKLGEKLDEDDDYAFYVLPVEKNDRFALMGGVQFRF